MGGRRVASEPVPCAPGLDSVSDMVLSPSRARVTRSSMATGILTVSADHWLLDEDCQRRH